MLGVLELSHMDRLFSEIKMSVMDLLREGGPSTVTASENPLRRVFLPKKRGKSRFSKQGSNVILSVFSYQ
jgi:hypothetical protein